MGHENVNMTIQMKATKPYFYVAMFMIVKKVCTFKSVDKTVKEKLITADYQLPWEDLPLDKLPWLAVLM